MECQQELWWREQERGWRQLIGAHFRRQTDFLSRQGLQGEEAMRMSLRTYWSMGWLVEQAMQPVVCADVTSQEAFPLTSHFLPSLALVFCHFPFLPILQLAIVAGQPTTSPLGSCLRATSATPVSCGSRRGKKKGGREMVLVISLALCLP